MRSLRLVVATVLALALAILSAPAASGAQLRAFRTCDEVVSFGRSAAAKAFIPTRISSGGFGSGFRARSPIPTRPKYTLRETEDSIQEATAVSGEPSPFSRTNVQEAGIDEPDDVKTDGRRLFVVVGAVLHAYDVSAQTPALLGTLDLGAYGGNLLLYGDRLVVLGAAGSYGDQTRLMEIDVSDPRVMRELRSVVVLGGAVTARLTGSTVRVVLNTQEHLPYSVMTRRGAKARRERRRLRLSSFVPTLRSVDRATGTRSVRRLVRCGDLRRPVEFSGLDLVSVLSFDVTAGLGAIQTTGVLGNAETIYASETALYVASTADAGVESDRNVDPGVVTEIHRFDTTQAGRTTYVASGEVPGFALNQYSMSEWQGDLRIATTESPTWIEGSETRKSESRVTVLRPDGTGLRVIGQVEGLGKGERIYSTRFMGPVAYLVTFRETDPLYTLDLADPAAPKVVGELKINGYSAYLHPIGDGLLLGVGQDATSTGETLGTQVSLFDVSNPAAPIRLAQQRLGNGGSLVEYDPHAFLWWAPLGLAVVPVWSDDESNTFYDTYNSAAVLRAGRAAGLAKVGEVTHGPLWDRAPVRRSIVIGDRLLTLSDFGIATSRLADVGLTAYTRFPEQPDDRRQGAGDPEFAE